MIFTRLDRIPGIPFKKVFGFGGLMASLPKDELGWLETEERWALRLMLGAPVVGLLAGLFSAIFGLGLVVLGFTLGATLRVNATCVRHVMNQRAMIELQRELIQEIRKGVADKNEKM